MTETLTLGYSSESTQRELSDEYQHDRSYMFFLAKSLGHCALVEIASALEGVNLFTHRAFDWTGNCVCLLSSYISSVYPAINAFQSSLNIEQKMAQNREKQYLSKL